jgi:NAD(P)-dependent dehydrogenase (short-subunit alcohol dehydrogenase family)
MTEFAIVAGGAKGIGRACATKLVAKGYAVSIWDLDGDAAHATVAALVKGGGIAEAMVIDIADETAVEEAVAALRSRTIPISVLVNSAGILAMTPIDDLDLALWDRVMRINLRGPLVCARAVVPSMKQRNSGSIINVVSNVVAAARLYNAAYSAAKSGLLGLTQVLALELARHNIRVNAISPGSTRTEMLDTYDAATLDGILKGNTETFRIGIPLGRFADPIDHANAVAFLASEDARHITGQNLFIDGGQTLA